MGKYKVHLQYIGIGPEANNPCLKTWETQHSKQITVAVHTVEETSSAGANAIVGAW